MKRVLCLVLLLLGFVNLVQAQQKDTDPFMIAGVMALREGKPDTTKKDLKILDAPVIGDMSYSICLDFIGGHQFFLEHNRASKKIILWGFHASGAYTKSWQEDDKTMHVKISKEEAFENGWRILRYFPIPKEFIKE